MKELPPQQPLPDQITIDALYEEVARGEASNETRRRAVTAWAEMRFRPCYDLEVHGAYPGMDPSEAYLVVTRTKTEGEDYAVQVEFDISEEGYLQTKFHYAFLHPVATNRKDAYVYGSWKEEQCRWPVSSAARTAIRERMDEEEELNRTWREKQRRHFDFVKQHLGTPLHMQDLPMGFSLVPKMAEGDRLTVTRQEDGSYHFVVHAKDGWLKDVLEMREPEE